MRAVGERTVDDIRVAGNPTDISRAPIDVAVVIVEHSLMGQRGIDEIAAGGVHHTLGRTRRARGVEDKERILGTHLFGRALGPRHWRQARGTKNRARHAWRKNRPSAG